MSDYSPGAIIERLALFPLPNAVLFPGALLPLHVFEPRYRAMTADVLNGTHELSVVLIRPGPLDEHGHPQIASIAGIGRIVRHERLHDGRYNIALQGMARVKLEELPFEPPYRTARALVVGSTGHASSADVAALVTSATRVLVEHNHNRADALEARLPDELVHAAADSGQIADRLAHALLFDTVEQQQVLETLDIGERVRRCSEALAVQQALIGERRDLS